MGGGPVLLHHELHEQVVVESHPGEEHLLFVEGTSFDLQVVDGQFVLGMDQVHPVVRQHGVLADLFGVHLFIFLADLLLALFQTPSALVDLEEPLGEFLEVLLLETVLLILQVLLLEGGQEVGADLLLQHKVDLDELVREQGGEGLDGGDHVGLGQEEGVEFVLESVVELKEVGLVVFVEVFQQDLVLLGGGEGQEGLGHLLDGLLLELVVVAHLYQ